jgi:hypothetical protein
MTMPQYARDLSSTTCRCTHSKLSMETFCNHCYKVLTKRLKKLIYTPGIIGYRDVYLECIEHLKSRGRIRK